MSPYRGLRPVGEPPSITLESRWRVAVVLGLVVAAALAIFAGVAAFPSKAPGAVRPVESPETFTPAELLRLSDDEAELAEGRPIVVSGVTCDSRDGYVRFVRGTDCTSNDRPSVICTLAVSGELPPPEGTTASYRGRFSQKIHNRNLLIGPDYDSAILTRCVRESASDPARLGVRP
jgi:hypothetical protein